jgi:phosphoethanolamine N-methyltransferase
MAAYIAAEGLDFGMASPRRYAEAMAAAGFDGVAIESRNAWYRAHARGERERLAGPLGTELAARLGTAFVAHNLEIWDRMLPVLDSGEHCPTHLRAVRPG